MDSPSAKSALAPLDAPVHNGLMKKLLLASDSFKGTISSRDILAIAQEVIAKSFPNWELEPQLIADGGEGTLDALRSLLGGRLVSEEASNAEGQTITAPILFLDGGTAVIETASVLGLPQVSFLVPPLERSTRGLGRLIEKSISLGAKRIYVGLGGTSTCDLGIGLLQELGLDFHINGRLTMMEAPEIQDISWGSFPQNVAGVNLICLTDVESPLLGPGGAVYVYGPQKGFGKKDLEYLESNFERLSRKMEALTGKEISSLPGGGAAGGLGACFHAFFSAPLVSGIDTILDLCHFDEKAKEADLVITGEGCFDKQSLQGKAISGILRRVDPSKLVLLVGKSKITRSPYEIWTTSRRGEDYNQVKKEAKERYASSLARILRFRS